MTAFGLFEAKNRFSELVERAQGGEDIVVTKHKRPVARIIAYAAAGADAEWARRQEESLARVRELRSKLVKRLAVEEIVGAGPRRA
jgi:prevent-host-death family protein